MSTHATATDSTAARDDFTDATAEAHPAVADATPETTVGSLTAAEAVAASPSPFDTTATKRLPNTTDGENQVVR
ncbi:hypothetical protein [Haloparvum sp. PAK95]|uniref:hypothetical protein n=1 Tax=Haloparvum sp. PAK95 TaxID=3418962 RepID=UPI003D2EE3CA